MKYGAGFIVPEPSDSNFWPLVKLKLRKAQERSFLTPETMHPDFQQGRRETRVLMLCGCITQLVIE